MRAAALPRGGVARLYRRLRWGDLAQFSVLDARQYRTDQPCGDGEFPRCPESLDPSVTMLGRRQERWLLDGLDRSRARVRNPMVITGDWHSTFVNDIKADFSNPDSATVATEFVGTSISSNGDVPVYGPYYDPMIPANPHTSSSTATGAATSAASSTAGIGTRTCVWSRP